jgi:hypothetical protein
VFVRLGDVVRALRALEARGGSARLALFERMWGPYAYAALGLALEWGLAERRGDVYRLSGRGRRLLRELDGCPVEARAAGGRLLLETPFGEYAAEPAVACCPSRTSWPRHAARGRRRCAAGSLRRPQRRWRTPKLENGSTRLRRKARGSLEALLSAGLRPETALEVVVHVSSDSNTV